MEADSGGTLITILDKIESHEEGYKRVDQKLLLQSVLHVLSQREKEMIHFTFIDNKSKKEIGEYLGMSQIHVSRLQRSAIRKLRKALERNAYTRLTND